MKKAIKFLLIVAVVLGVAYGGYWAYNKYIANKMEKIDSAEGLELYNQARSKSLNESEYSVTYTLKGNRVGENRDLSTSITVDNFGYYEVVDGGETGGRYAMNLGSGKYGLFTDKNETKTSKIISAIEYREIRKMSSIENLSFLKETSVEANQTNIKNTFYSDVSITDENEFEQVFGSLKDAYVWKTTYTCQYIGTDGKTYSSKLVRKVTFNGTIENISIEITDKEVDSEGKTVRKGEKKTLSISYDIKHKSNQYILKTNFEEFPRLG